ncbi:MAG: pyridoxine/pyridoxamine 5'-phosphate oxidase [marine bacterium B5-7]|nr:MAG: pyridoxine/pyridoxamine 5'-phosphate oxidase [marine bacterium B5-7]
MSNKNLHRIYEQGSLSIDDVAADPMAQFSAWYREAEVIYEKETCIMSLSTVSADNRPHSRIVLLKDFNENGLVFFTNYDSHKGKEIAGNPFGALLFFWPSMGRQVRIEGRIEKASRDVSAAYFNSRPRASQIGATVSPQSKLVTDRAALDKAFDDMLTHAGDTPLPCPENWGGYVLAPDRMEFWQGRDSRFHDRLLYTQNDAQWQCQRLAP